VAAWRKRASGGGLTGGLDAETLATIPIPEHRPPHGDLHLDRLGRLWVQVPRSLDPAEVAAPTVWMVFGRDGRYAGTVETPDLEVLEIGEAHLIGLRRDELGVEQVQAFRIRE
jgi:hypothetical protein